MLRRVSIIIVFVLFLAAFGSVLLMSKPVRTRCARVGNNIRRSVDSARRTVAKTKRKVENGLVKPRDMVVKDTDETEGNGETEATGGDEASEEANVIDPPEGSKKYALLVGVNDYEKLRGLRFAANDVKLIRERLLKMGFQPDNIFTLTSESPAADHPTKRHIEERIDQILSLAGPDDMIFLAFSGHGIQIDKTIYYCPQDTRDTQDKVADSAVSISALIERLEDAPARFKWMVVDACRDNPFQTRSFGTDEQNIRTLDDPPKGLMILQSCANKEVSIEDEKLEHGLFTYNFAEALDGAADTNKDGKLTLFEVCKYTTEKTADMSQELNRDQHPFTTGKYGGFSDFVIFDGLRIDGLMKEEWDEVERLYLSAQNDFIKGRHHDAKEKIDQVLKMVESVPETNKTLLNCKVMEHNIEIALGLGHDDKSPDENYPVSEDDIGRGLFSGQKKTLTVNGIDFTFCWCPPGEFEMGSPASENEGRETSHHVTLTSGFWLLESEVTREMWMEIMGDEKEDDLDEREDNGSQFPMYKVNWYEAQDFCKKLSELSGKNVTLPTEAQWEYACRAGTTGKYGGTGRRWDMGWNRSNSSLRKNRYERHQVKGKTKNAWGLYDMHGNVKEWCQDYYRDNYPSSSETDPVGSKETEIRPVRGGCYRDDPDKCRSAFRGSANAKMSSDDLGFRVAILPGS